MTTTTSTRSFSWAVNSTDRPVVSSYTNAKRPSSPGVSSLYGQEEREERIPGFAGSSREGNKGIFSSPSSSTTILRFDVVVGFDAGVVDVRSGEVSTVVGGIACVSE